MYQKAFWVFTEPLWHYNTTNDILTFSIPFSGWLKGLSRLRWPNEINKLLLYQMTSCCFWIDVNRLKEFSRPFISYLNNCLFGELDLKWSSLTKESISEEKIKIQLGLQRVPVILTNTLILFSIFPEIQFEWSENINPL